MFRKKDEKLADDSAKVSLNVYDDVNGVKTLGDAPTIFAATATEQAIAADAFANSAIGNMVMSPAADGKRNEEVTIGSRWQHFKGDIVEVKALARHTETEEIMVIYDHGSSLWARPINLFLDNTDVSNRPDNVTKQKYRFEKIG